jgi:hypothetical protein
MKATPGRYVAWLVAAVMLVLAVTGRHPYSFYTLLRWICCAAFAYSAFTAHERNRAAWAWIFGALTVLFNPIVPFHFQRDTWLIIDWGAIGVIVVACIVFWPSEATGREEAPNDSSPLAQADNRREYEKSPGRREELENEPTSQGPDSPSSSGNASRADESPKLPQPPTYRVARGGVEIGQFEASDFFDAIHSGVVRLDDFVWMKGLVNWMRVSELLSAPVKEPQVVAPANSIASVKQPKAPAKEKLAAIGKGIGGLLLGALAVLVIGLVLIGGAKLAVWIQPWVEGLAALTLGTLIPLCLLLLIFRKTRGYGGIGIYFASYAIGLALWIFCFLYAVGVSLFWTIVGILMAGLGIVPVAAIMTLIRGDWSNFGSILGAVLVVFALRRLGAWIVEKSERWDAEAEAREEAFEAQGVKKGNYFVQHWRGQLSLGVSYWVSGLVAGLLLGLVAGTAKPIQEALSLRLSCGLSMFLYTLAIASEVWWLIGVWRSASNHVSRGGRRFWAGVAEAMVVLGFLNIFAATYKIYVPQSIEMLSIIAGDAGMPSYKVRVLPGGKYIEFRGGLRAGSARELERILAGAPQATVLQIESPGGRIREAQEMMKLIRERELATYTSEECESAATLLLMSGKQRVVAADAKVGFHSGTFPGMTLEQKDAADDLVRSIMRSAGVTTQFIDHVLATPPDQMWYPSFAEMWQNGVVTAQSYGENVPPAQERQLVPEYAPPAAPAQTGYLAPEGYLFLKTRINVPAGSAQFLPAGTLVRSWPYGENYRVTADGIVIFDLTPNNLTNSWGRSDAAFVAYVQGAANAIAQNLRQYYGVQ